MKNGVEVMEKETGRRPALRPGHPGGMGTLELSSGVSWAPDLKSVRPSGRLAGQLDLYTEASLGLPSCPAAPLG